MNYKTLIFTLFLAYLILLFSACEKDEVFSKNDLPELGIVFFNTYFPDFEITSVTEGIFDDIPGYHVSLEDNISVFITSEGYWKEINAPGGIPESAMELISIPAASRLKGLEPSAEMVKLKFIQAPSPNNTVGFIDEILITMDNNCQYIDAISAVNNSSILATVIPFPSTPPGLKQFLRRNSMESQIQHNGVFLVKTIEPVGVVYRLTFGPYLSFYFDSEYNWILGRANPNETSGPSALLKTITLNEIPENILRALSAGGGDIGGSVSRLYAVVCYQDGTYAFRFDGDNDFLVNSQGLLDSGGDYAKNFAKEYFNIDNISIYNQLPIIETPYSCSILYMARSGEIEFMLKTDKNGRWLSLTSSNDMIRKMVESLPENIGKYLNENYNDTEFYTLRYMKAVGGEEIYMIESSSQKKRIYFYLDGEYLGTQEIINE